MSETSDFTFYLEKFILEGTRIHALKTEQSPDFNEYFHLSIYLRGHFLRLLA